MLNFDPPPLDSKYWPSGYSFRTLEYTLHTMYKCFGVDIGMFLKSFFFLGGGVQYHFNSFVIISNLKYFHIIFLQLRIPFPEKGFVSRFVKLY